MKNLYPLVMAVLLLLTTSVYAQVPVLNSYPSAQAVIFLDFDGHTVNGTSWNTNGPIHCGPSNLNSTQITEIFNRVAEDYRPFNINITTDSTRYWKAPSSKRMRVILTITSKWYGNAGGVAFTGSFTWGDNTPCFVFTALHKYNVKNIAEAAAHEAGHTLGLRHQSKYDANCVRTEDYNSGVGSGQISWAPIMGVGYYRNQTTWHNGPNPFGCSYAQDDLAIITSSTNGFGYRPVDKKAPASFATAWQITNTNNQLEGSGLIATNTDNNYFKLSVPTLSLVNLKVAPYSVSTTGDVGSNLDVQVKLYDEKQQLLNTYNPPELLSAALDTTLNAGDYYMVVNGTGNAYTTSYASLGSFSIQGTMKEMKVLPLRRLELKGNADGNRHKLTWLIDADEAVTRQVVEVSSNGVHFEPIAQLGNDDRSFDHYAAAHGSVQYRIQVSFDNGKQHYSNIIAMRNANASARPQLFTNVIHSNALMVSSPGTFQYLITDLNGKPISQGQVTQGSATVSTGHLAAGIYLIRFSNGSSQFVEKFTRR